MTAFWTKSGVRTTRILRKLIRQPFQGRGRVVELGKATVHAETRKDLLANLLVGLVKYVGDLEEKLKNKSYSTNQL